MNTAPFTETWVKDVRPGAKVAVSGLVISRDGERFILDDGTGQITVQLPSPPPSDYLKVYGLAADEAFLEGAFAQDLSSIDKFLYLKSKKILV